MTNAFHKNTLSGERSEHFSHISKYLKYELCAFSLDGKLKCFCSTQLGRLHTMTEAFKRTIISCLCSSTSHRIQLSTLCRFDSDIEAHQETAACILIPCKFFILTHNSHNFGRVVLSVNYHASDKQFFDLCLSPFFISVYLLCA